MYTDPRTWGVYEVSTAAGKNFRFGNHPVRGAELAQDHESVKVIAILLGRELARELASLLNGKKMRIVAGTSSGLSG